MINTVERKKFLEGEISRLKGESLQCIDDECRTIYSNKILRYQKELMKINNSINLGVDISEEIQEKVEKENSNFSFIKTKKRN